MFEQILPTAASMTTEDQTQALCKLHIQRRGLHRNGVRSLSRPTATGLGMLHPDSRLRPAAALLHPEANAID